MKDLGWRSVGREELAALLEGCRHVASSALGTATVYRLERDGRVLLAIALPDGQAVVVESAAPARRRRRVEVNPASR